MADFHPALPLPVKYSTNENRYDQGGKQPRTLSLFIPLESAYALAQYIMNVAEDQSKHKTGKVWNYQQKAEVEVTGIYLNGKGREGTTGEYGTINPGSTKAEAAALDASAPLPF